MVTKSGNSPWLADEDVLKRKFGLKGVTPDKKRRLWGNGLAPITLFSKEYGQRPIVRLILPPTQNDTPVSIDPAGLFKGPFKARPEEKRDRSVKDKPDEEPPESEEFIRCRACHRVVTHPRERTEVQGAHRHTFANPSGVVFEIGCFGTAAGCAYAGPTTDEFSWFRGHRWKIAVCGGCLSHLGWRFISTGGHAFHGLILNRLIEP